MILVDANLLVYAYVSSFAQHRGAREWLDSRLNGTAQVALPWASILGFLRLVKARDELFENGAYASQVQCK
jgi:predicted nucleic acid-binding protein